MDEKTIGSLAELHALLREFDTAMLVTHVEDGGLRARPMALQDPADVPGCDLWFATADDSPKTGEIRAEQHVNVCCFRQRDGAWLSISAVAQIDDQPSLVERLWKDDWKIWMPEDPADGGIAILKLTVELAEYWRPEGGRMKLLYQLPDAPATDEVTAPDR